MKTQHTPGPWTYRQAYDNGEPTAFEVDAGRGNVATVATGAGDVDREEANARLIAAAPDLLAALKQCTHFIENSGSAEEFFITREAWRNAITKAIG